MKVDLHGRTALVTGASSGLGADFARELARRRADLVLVARSEDKLRELAAALEREFAITVTVEVLDLSRAEAPIELATRLEARGIHVDILINNAGFGSYGEFLNIGADAERDMLTLHIVNLTAITRAFAPAMKARGWGRIMQVSSIGAYQPSPTYAVYSAAKSYVLMYGRAINYELRGSGVTCTVLSPGVTRTSFLEVAGQQASLYQRMVMMESPRVARAGVGAMLRGQGELVPGWFNKLSAFATRLVPRGLAAAMVWQLMTR